MQVVKIRSKAQSFDGAFDVLLNVRGGIGDGSISFDVEATFRGNWQERKAIGLERSKPLEGREGNVDDG